MEVCKRETNLVSDQSQSSFSADLCAFALDILTPIAPPPHRDVSFASRYRSRKVLRQGAQIYSHRNNTSSKAKKRQSDVESAAEDTSEVDDANGSNSNSSNSGGSDLEGATSCDDVDMERSVTEEDISPDLRPIGFNLRLLGSLWASSEVVKQLLRIVFACLLGRLANQSCVERLVASALSPDIRGTRGLYWRMPAPPPPPPTLDHNPCQPHWCINWLLRQIVDASEAVEKFSHRLLNACFRGPPLGQLPPVLSAVEYHRFWALAGLSNLAFCCVFFTQSVRLSLAKWLKEKLTHMREENVSTSLIHVIALLLIISPRGSALTHSTLARLKQQPPPSLPPPGNGIV